MVDRSVGRSGLLAVSASCARFISCAYIPLGRRLMVRYRLPVCLFVFLAIGQSFGLSDDRPSLLAMIARRTNVGGRMRAPPARQMVVSSILRYVCLIIGENLNQGNHSVTFCNQNHLSIRPMRLPSIWSELLKNHESKNYATITHRLPSYFKRGYVLPTRV